MLKNLSQIDQLTVGDHYYLEDGDEVWYFAEYSSGKGYTHSPANQLITNLKHSVEHRTHPPSGRWYFKTEAINKVALALNATLSDSFKSSVTFVPIPPSVVKSDPLYDSRMHDILQLFKAYSGNVPDVRELLYQKHSTRKSHISSDRVTKAELMDAYSIDESIATPMPKAIALVDDVLTTGTHFLAARQKLKERYGAIPILGIFVCRRKLESVIDGFEIEE